MIFVGGMCPRERCGKPLFEDTNVFFDTHGMTRRFTCGDHSSYERSIPAPTPPPSYDIVDIAMKARRVSKYRTYGRTTCDRCGCAIVKRSFLHKRCRRCSIALNRERMHAKSSAKALARKRA